MWSVIEWTSDKTEFSRFLEKKKCHKSIPKFWLSFKFYNSFQKEFTFIPSPRQDRQFTIITWSTFSTDHSPSVLWASMRLLKKPNTYRCKLIVYYLLMHQDKWMAIKHHQIFQIEKYLDWHKREKQVWKKLKWNIHYRCFQATHQSVDDSWKAQKPLVCALLHIQPTHCMEKGLKQTCTRWELQIICYKLTIKSFNNTSGFRGRA